MKDNINLSTEKCEKELECMDSNYHELIKSILRNNRRTIKALTSVCIACVVTTLISVAIMVGGMLYFLSSYSVEVTDEITTTYEQESDGNSNIINGNQYKDNSTHNDK